MFELATMSPSLIIFFVLCASGVVSWGLTELVKKFMIAYQRRYETKEWWWWNSILRTTATILGSIAGALLLKPLMLGLIVGLCGGILNTTIVAVVKKKLNATVKEKQTLENSHTTSADTELSKHSSEEYFE